MTQPDFTRSKRARRMFVSQFVTPTQFVTRVCRNSVANFVNLGISKGMRIPFVVVVFAPCPSDRDTLYNPPPLPPLPPLSSSVVVVVLIDLLILTTTMTVIMMTDGDHAWWRWRRRWWWLWWRWWWRRRRWWWCQMLTIITSFAIHCFDCSVWNTD